MEIIKKTLLRLTVFLIVASANAQEETGLLLGFRYGGNYQTNATLDGKGEELTQEPASYRTLWLRTQDGQLKSATEKTNLLVPQEDGFWRVDVRHSIYNNFTEDFLWVNPPPDPDMPANPFLANKEGVEAFDVAILVKAQSIEGRRGEHCTGHANRDILFVENNYLSVGYTHSETCRGVGEGTHENALQVLNLENLEPLDKAKILGNLANLEKTAKSYQDKYKGRPWGPLSSGIIRGQGQWLVKGHLPTQGEYINFEVNTPIPENIAKPVQLVPNWETIKKQVPEAIDAFTSPRQTLLVVLTKSNLLTFTVAQGKMSPQPTLQLTFEHPLAVVMAQWAEGQLVDNWSQEIESIGPKPNKTWFAEAPISQAKVAGTPDFQLTGVVTTAPGVALNVREGMGEHTKLIAKLEKNTKLRILDVLGEWYKVQLENGQQGYAHSSYVKILPKLPYQKPACPLEECSYGQWRLKNPTALYATPSASADRLAQLEAQQILQALRGQITTSQYGEIAVVRDSEINALPLDAPSVDNKEILKLNQGDLLFDLEYQGKGIHVMWYQGKLYYLEEAWNPETSSQAELWGKILTERKTDWWVQVEVSKPSLKGWIVNPQAENFVDNKPKA